MKIDYDLHDHAKKHDGKRSLNSTKDRTRNMVPRKVVQLIEEIEVASLRYENNVDSSPTKSRSSINTAETSSSCEKDNKDNSLSIVKEARNLERVVKPPGKDKKGPKWLRKIPKKSLTRPCSPPLAKIKSAARTSQREVLNVNNTDSARAGRRRRSTAPKVIKTDVTSETTVDQQTGNLVTRKSMHEHIYSDHKLVNVTSSVILATTFTHDEQNDNDDNLNEPLVSCCSLEKCSTFDSAGDSLMYAGYSLSRSFSMESFATLRSLSRLEDGDLGRISKKKIKSKYYFQTEDFDIYSWQKVKSAVHSNLPSTIGMAVVATATVIIHPLLFVAGAVWAVGMFHVVEHGYKFYSDGAFGAMFWGSEDDELKKLHDAQNKLLDSQPSGQNRPKEESTTPSHSEIIQPKVEIEKTEDSIPPPIPQTKAPEQAKASTAPISESPSDSATLDESIRAHFPTLESEVVSEIPFPNIHAKEFFRVFFSDAAPYSMKYFQEERGDIEVNFGKWQKEFTASPVHGSVSFLFPSPFKGGHVRERSTSFKTLTKSVLGPSYASASTHQRVTRIKDRYIIIENQTQLHDIPYGDRFVVMERWTILTKNVTDDSVTSYLTVHLEVKMLKSCSFERQIRKKTASTMKSYVESWCAKATEALARAEMQKAERIRHSIKAEDINKTSATPKLKTLRGATELDLQTAENERLLAVHKEKLKKIQDEMELGEFQYEFEHVETSHTTDVLDRLATRYIDSFGETGTIIHSSLPTRNTKL